MAAPAALLFPLSLPAADAKDQIKISIDGFKITSPFNGKQWSVSAENLTIDGLTFPKFSSGWLGLQLASGVVAQVGGLIFHAFLQKIGLGGPDIEKLLRDQLVAIGEIVVKTIRNNELRKCGALFSSIQRDMREYVNNKSSKYRLDTATSDSSRLLSELESLGFVAYSLYMQAASLRLAILQERCALSRREVKNLGEAIEEYSSYHEGMERQVNSLTLEGQTKQELAARQRAGQKGASALIAKASKQPTLFVRITRTLFDVKPQDLPRLPESHRNVKALRKRITDQVTGGFEILAAQFGVWINLKLKEELKAKHPYVSIVDWNSFQSRIRRQYVDIDAGSRMVAMWKKVKCSPKTGPVA